MHHPMNCGKGAALRTGFAVAKARYVIVQDADLETPGRILQTSSASHYRQSGRGVRKPLCRWRSHAHSLFLALLGQPRPDPLSNMFTNLSMTDMETCYKVFRREIIQGVKIQENRFGFEPEIVAKVRRVPGIRIYEVPISYYGRTYAEGKKISWRDGIRAIWCIVKYNVLS